MIDARAFLAAMLDVIENDPALAERVRRVLVPVVPPFVDRDTAAEQTNVERRALDAMIADGRVPARKVGRRVLVSVDDVRAALTNAPTMPVAPKSEENVVEIDPALRRRLHK